jgi:hypothetical protein
MTAQDHSRRVSLQLAALATLTVLVVPSAAMGQPVLGTFDRTLNVAGPVDLEVTPGSGDITIRTGPAASVHIIGRIRASQSWFGAFTNAGERVKYLESNPPIEQTGNTIRIGRIPDREALQHVSISYEIVAPAQCRLTSHTGSGDQHIGDISGPVEIGSGSGDLTLGRVGGRVDASTGSGDITASAIGGGFSARTGSGSVTAREVRGEVTVSTGSGDIEVVQAAPGTVRINSGSGDVRLDGIQGELEVDSSSGDVSVQGTPTRRWDISTSSGGITMVVPQTAAFDLDAHSSSGGIVANHPVTIVGAIERHSLTGKVRGGGPLVRVRASSGGIRIE